MIAQQPARYVLATGDEAAARLALVNAVHGPDTERALQVAGLTAGLRVADIGCGTGFITRHLARNVGAKGNVTAVDVSAPQVATMLAVCAAEGITNVAGVTADAAATGLPGGQFDLVFSRFVLMHCADPQAVMHELVRLVKPGGVVLCEDGDFSTPFAWPPVPELERCFELYRSAGEAEGADFKVGKRLFSLARAAGLTAMWVQLCQPVMLNGDARRLPEWTLSECAAGLIERGLTSADEVEQIVDKLQRVAADQDVLIAMAQTTQVCGRRPASAGAGA